MADSKITALTSIGASTDPANDPLVLVDVSDTSMAATGTTKKVTLNQLLGASGTATLASATITGDLTVDTSTLKVDSANDRVGVGTTSPAVRFNIADADNPANGTIRLGVGAIYSQIKMSASSTGRTDFTNVGNGVNGAYNFSIDGQDQYRIAASGVFSWYDGAGGTRMTLNSTGLGVGVTPITGHKLSSVGPIGLSAGPNSYVANGNYCSMYYTDGSGASFPFLEYGNLVIQPRNERNVVIATAPSAGNHVGRVVVKLGGQVRFVPLAADPSGAESGDVYYNSTSNKLKCYNGTTWNDLF